jgi:hypothetical protein
MNIKLLFFPLEMCARSQNQNSDSESSLQSRPRPHNYTRRSVHVHITILPETSAPTYPYLPLPSAPTELFAQSASAPFRPSRPHPPSRCRPQGQRPTSCTRHCVRARLHVCAHSRDDVAVHVTANVDKVSQIYHGRQSTPV